MNSILSKKKKKWVKKSVRLCFKEIYLGPIIIYMARRTRENKKRYHNFWIDNLPTYIVFWQSIYRSSIRDAKIVCYLSCKKFLFRSSYLESKVCCNSQWKWIDLLLRNLNRYWNVWLFHFYPFSERDKGRKKKFPSQIPAPSSSSSLLLLLLLSLLLGPLMWILNKFMQSFLFLCKDFFQFSILFYISWFDRC